MSEPDTRSTEQRLDALEQAVAGLQNSLHELTASPRTRARTARSLPTERPRAAPHIGKDPPWKGLADRGPLFWISRLGIGLVLLSVVFLFDYAVDRGWLTPPVRGDG